MASVVNLPASVLRFYAPGDCSQDKWLGFIPGEVYTQRIKFDSMPADLSRIGIWYRLGTTLYPLTGTLTQVGSLNEYVLQFTAPDVTCAFNVVITEVPVQPVGTLVQGFEVNDTGTTVGGTGSPVGTRVNDPLEAFVGDWSYQATGSSDQSLNTQTLVPLPRTYVGEQVVFSFAYQAVGTAISYEVGGGGSTASIIGLTYDEVPGVNGYTVVTATGTVTGLAGEVIDISVNADSPAPSEQATIWIDQFTIADFVPQQPREIAASACISREPNSALLEYESNCNVAGYSYATDPETSAIRVSAVISDALPQIEEDLFTTSTGQELQLRATVVDESRISFAYLPADALKGLVLALKHPTLRIDGEPYLAKNIEASDTDRFASLSRTLTATLRPAEAGVVFTDCCA
jgi:hypothetical protein